MARPRQRKGMEGIRPIGLRNEEVWGIMPWLKYIGVFDKIKSLLTPSMSLIITKTTLPDAKSNKQMVVIMRSSCHCVTSIVKPSQPIFNFNP